MSVQYSGEERGRKNEPAEKKRRLEEIKRKERKKRHKNTVLSVLFLLAVLIVGTYLCREKLFKIDKIRVYGECPYSETELAEGMKIKLGDSLYGKSDEELKQNIKYNLAYIDKAEISRIWPGTLKLTVEEAKPTFYITMENTMYILSQSLRVLSKTEDIEEIELKKLVYVELNEINSCVEGEFLSANKDAEEILKTLYELLTSYEVFSQISTIDVTDKFDITLSFGTKYRVKLGDEINLESKIGFMLTIIEEKQKDGMGGIIDVSDDDVKEGTFESFT